MQDRIHATQMPCVHYMVDSCMHSRALAVINSMDSAGGKGRRGGGGNGGGSGGSSQGPRDDDSSPSLEWYTRAVMTMLGAVGLYVMLGRSTVPRSKAQQEREHRTSGPQPGAALLQPESLRCLPVCAGISGFYHFEALVSTCLNVMTACTLLLHKWGLGTAAWLLCHCQWCVQQFSEECCKRMMLQGCEGSHRKASALLQGGYPGFEEASARDFRGLCGREPALGQAGAFHLWQWAVEWQWLQLQSMCHQLPCSPVGSCKYGPLHLVC